MAGELQGFSLDRTMRAVEMVRVRLLRSTAALEVTGVPYAVVDGNAVAAWVAQDDTRNTLDVDILIRSSDLDSARAALESAGFIYRHSAGMDMFLDGPAAKARDAVHIVSSHEKVRPDEPVKTRKSQNLKRRITTGFCLSKLSCRLY